MNVQVDKKTEAIIARKVSEGEFRDATEAVGEAVRQIAERADRMRELRAALQSGIDQADRGEVVEFTPDLARQIFAEAMRRFDAGERPKRDVTP